MACNECTQQEPCVSNDCSCPIIDFPTSCLKYTGPDLECSKITNGQNFDEVLQQLDQFICDKIDFVSQLGNLKNIGAGAIIYAGDNLAGEKQLKTIISQNLNLLDVIENSDTIGIQPGNYTITIEGSDIVLSVTTLAGTTELSREPLGIASNTYVVSGVYSSGNIRYTLNDASFFDVDVTTILTEAAANQINSDYTESNPSSKAFIENKNPTKTVTLGVAGVYNVVDSDNNYVIEIDNGANDVTVNLLGITLTDNFFTGFIQKGTGLVTFINYTVKPADLQDIMYGTGHIASVEVVNSTKYLLGSFKPI